MSALSLPLTKDAIYRTAGLFDGMPHGDDAAGLIDIEFPDVVKAVAFADMWKEHTAVTLREPIETLDGPVVIQIQSKGAA